MRSGRCTWAKLDTSRFGITLGRRFKTIEAYESITSYFPALANRLEGCEIDKGPRAQEKPSDHTPIIVTLSDLT
jgi:exonuclease III